MLGIWLFRVVKSRRRLVRLPVEFGSVALVLLGSVSVLLFIVVLTWGSRISKSSAPIYSPDRKYAIRVESTDEGALGGVTSVVLYSAHGLQTDMIFSGEGNDVEVKDVHWIGNDSVLVLYHHPSQPPYICSSAREVTVRCQQALESAH